MESTSSLSPDRLEDSEDDYSVLGGRAQTDCEAGQPVGANDAGFPLALINTLQAENQKLRLELKIAELERDLAKEKSQREKCEQKYSELEGVCQQMSKMMAETNARNEVLTKKSEEYSTAEANAKLVQEMAEIGYLMDELETKPKIRKLLNSAVNEGAVERMKWLLRVCASANVVSSVINSACDGWTPLTLAAKKGNDRMVKLLLENGADVNWKGGNWKATALHYATLHSGLIDAFKVLIQHGPDVELEADGQYQNRPIHIAAWNGNLEALCLLLKAGARTNVINSDVHTPLYDGVMNSNVDTVRILLDHSLDKYGKAATVAMLNARDKWGSTALKEALKRGKQEVAQLLEQNGATR